MSRSTPLAEARRASVLSRYGDIARGQGCCGGSADAGTSGGSCCAGSVSCGHGAYSALEIEMLPESARLSLGCGNPGVLADLRAGEVVLDLGSGAGGDAFLAARRVGTKGRVIGVDMTPEMIARARQAARAGRYRSVEFRLGELEHLPVGDRSVDVVVSNCVVNLVPDQRAAYREAFRVLRPGGRLAVSDLVAVGPISASARRNPEAWPSCAVGAARPRRLRAILRAAGFRRIRIRTPSEGLGRSPRLARGRRRLAPVVPAEISAVRPSG